MLGGVGVVSHPRDETGVVEPPQVHLVVADHHATGCGELEQDAGGDAAVSDEQIGHFELVEPVRGQLGEEPGNPVLATVRHEQGFARLLVDGGAGVVVEEDIVG